MVLCSCRSDDGLMYPEIYALATDIYVLNKIRHFDFLINKFIKNINEKINTIKIAIL